MSRPLQEQWRTLAKRFRGIPATHSDEIGNAELDAIAADAGKLLKRSIESGALPVAWEVDWPEAGRGGPILDTHKTVAWSQVWGGLMTHCASRDDRFPTNPLAFRQLTGGNGVSGGVSSGKSWRFRADAFAGCCDTLAEIIDAQEPAGQSEPTPSQQLIIDKLTESSKDVIRVLMSGPKTLTTLEHDPSLTNSRRAVDQLKEMKLAQAGGKERDKRSEGYTLTDAGKEIGGILFPDLIEARTETR